jgi:hypothetical protein
MSVTDKKAEVWKNNGNDLNFTMDGCVAGMKNSCS